MDNIGLTPESRIEIGEIVSLVTAAETGADGCEKYECGGDCGCDGDSACCNSDTG